MPPAPLPPTEPGTPPGPAPTPAPEPPPESAAQIIRRLGPASALAAIAATLPAISGIVLMAYTPTVGLWLRSHQGAGLAIYVGGFALAAGLALLPTYAQAALGGYAFGPWVGVPAALAGFAGGSWIGYEIGRRASGDRARRLIAEHPRWQAVRDALVKDHAERGFLKTLGMVALVRCPPTSPFALMNLLMSSVGVPRAPYILGTVLGMAPRTALAVWIGAAFAETASSAELAEHGFTTPAWLKWGGLAAGAAVMIVIMLIANRALKRIGAPPPAPGGGASAP